MVFLLIVLTNIGIILLAVSILVMYTSYEKMKKLLITLSNQQLILRDNQSVLQTEITRLYNEIKITKKEIGRRR